MTGSKRPRLPLSPVRETLRKFRQFFSNIAFVHKYVWKHAPGEASLLLAITFFRGLQGVAQIYLTKLLVDKVLDAGVAGPDYPHIFLILALLAALVVVNRLVHPLEAFCQGRAGLALTKTLTETIMRKAGTVPFEMYDNSSYYDVLDRAKRETGSNPMDMLLYSLWFLQAGLGVISMLGAVLAFHWVAGLVVVATALPGIVFQYKVAHRSWRVMNDTTPAVRRLNYLRDLVTQRRAAKEVRLFGLVPWIDARYGAEYAQYARRLFCAMSPFKSSRNHLRCCPLFFLIVGSSIAAD